MHPKLKTLKIEKLFGHKDIELHFNDVTVLVGKNGLGKTTLLKILHALLLRSYSITLNDCFSAELIFDDEFTISYRTNGLSENVKHILNHIFSISVDSERFLEFSEKVKLGVKLSKKYGEDVPEELLSIDDNNENFKNLFSGIPQTEGKFSFSDNISNYLDTIASVDFISTINMSANSQQFLTGSDGRQGNLLDWEIEKEISDIVKTPKGKYTLAFIKEVNRHFADSGKKVQIKDGLKVITPDSKTPLPVSKLSSGERQLLYIMAKVANTKNSPAFLLMDEPEISLHLNWQEKLLDSIKTLNPNCQIVVVTHSPAIIMDGYMDSYIDMENIVVESRNV